MNKEKTKIVARVVFSGIETDTIRELMEHHGIAKAQDLVKFLVMNEAKKLREIDLRYGSKRKEPVDDTPKPPTSEERADIILNQSDPRMTIGLLAESGLYHDGFVLRLTTGEDFADTLTPEEKAIMPKSFEKEKYLYSEYESRKDYIPFPELRKELIKYFSSPLSAGAKINYAK